MGLRLQPSQLRRLHKESSHHADALGKAGGAGCFYCLRICRWDEIVEWCDGGETAICPGCGIDSLIPMVAEDDPGRSPAVVEERIEILRQMRAYWFSASDKRYRMSKGKMKRIIRAELHESDDVDLKELQRRVHAMATEKGFWDETDDFKGSSIGTKLALIHSEVSEAMEEFRDPSHELDDVYLVDGKPEGFGVELADVIIRVLDLAEKTGNDMAALINLKMRFNATRPTRHGGKRA